MFVVLMTVFAMVLVTAACMIMKLAWEYLGSSWMISIWLGSALGGAIFGLVRWLG